MEKPSPLERLHRTTIPVTESGCWLWFGYTSRHGYGRIIANGIVTHVHRFAYELYKGPIPAGLAIDHICRVRCCVNPDHLRAITYVENVMIGESFSAKNHRKTHCKWGHEFTRENTMKIPKGRACRACAVAYNERKKAARRMNVMAFEGQG